MLADKDRIFLNLYGTHGADLESAKRRGAWNGTADMIAAGKWKPGMGLAEVQKEGLPVLAYGSFLTAVLDFAILAFCVFLMVKLMNTAMKRPAISTLAKSPGGIVAAGATGTQGATWAPAATGGSLTSCPSADAPPRSSWCGSMAGRRPAPRRRASRSESSPPSRGRHGPAPRPSRSQGR